MNVLNQRALMERRAAELDQSILKALFDYINMVLDEEYSPMLRVVISPVDLEIASGQNMSLFDDGERNPYLDQIIFWFREEHWKVSAGLDMNQPRGYIIAFE